MGILDWFKDIDKADLFASVGDLFDQNDGDLLEGDDAMIAKNFDDDHDMYSTPAYLICYKCHSRMPLDILNEVYTCPICGLEVSITEYVNDDYNEDTGF